MRQFWIDHKLWVEVASFILALAIPQALRNFSWRRLVKAVLFCVAGVFLPLLIFGASAILTPNWKGGCPLGWVDCFPTGKLALTPLVIWAVASLDALEIGQASQPQQIRWVQLGIFTGAIVSSVCLGMGIVSGRAAGMDVRVWPVIVPVYVAAWFWIRTIQMMRRQALEWWEYGAALLGSLPFWIGSVAWSRQVYSGLPDQPPSCFVVTAATKGHRRLVGPFFTTVHGSRIISANRQLISLWAFEALWRSRFPRSHRLMRAAYNTIGPRIAAGISNPWLADLMFLALKPIELAAGIACGSERCLTLNYPVRLARSPNFARCTPSGLPTDFKITAL
jgi:hypothetical protein